MPIFLNLPQGKIYSNHFRHFDITLFSFEDLHNYFEILHIFLILTGKKSTDQ